MPALTTRRTRRLLAMGAALTATALLAACSSSSSNSSSNASGGATSSTPAGPTDKVLHLSFLEDPGPGAPDPGIYYAGQGLLLTTNMYEGLLTYKTGTKTPTLEPLLATAWTASADFKTYTFKLRQGVKFHDGTPFTSAAIKASFDREKAVAGGPSYMVSDIASITTQGDFDVTIKLTDSNSAFLSYMASPYGPRIISPTGLTANAGKDHAQTYLLTHSLGTGPYQLSDAKIGSHYGMTAFADYWGTKPYFQTIDIPVITDTSSQQLQLKSGQLAAILHDLPSSAVSSFTSDKKLSTYSLPTMQSDYLYVNPGAGMFTDQSTRQALLQAIDTGTITKNVYFGRGTQATQVYPANMMADQYALQNITYDTAPLKAKIASATDKNITIGYDSSSPDNQQAANVIQATLQGLGLTVKVQSYPTAQIFGWISNPKGAPNILVTNGWPDAPPPYTWGHISWDKGAGLNYFNCHDDATSAALAKGLKSGLDADFSEAAVDVVKTGCFLNMTNVDDFMVAQPWLKGVAESHVVSAPNSLYLATLHE